MRGRVFRSAGNTDEATDDHAVNTDINLRYLGLFMTGSSRSWSTKIPFASGFERKGDGTLNMERKMLVVGTSYVNRTEGHVSSAHLTARQVAFSSLEVTLAVMQ